jgi:hypothetical protein
MKKTLYVLLAGLALLAFAMPITTSAALIPISEGAPVTDLTNLGIFANPGVVLFQDPPGPPSGDASDILIFFTDTVAGPQFGHTIAAECSDPFIGPGSTIDAGDTPCDTLLAPFGIKTPTTFDLAVAEAPAVNGTETTVYVPGPGQPGFGNGNYGVISDTPEPASLALLGGGLLGLAALVRKRKKLFG